MPEPRTARRRPAAPPRHGRAPDRGALRARRFGPLTLVLAAACATGAGMGVATAVVPGAATVISPVAAAITEPGPDDVVEAPAQQQPLVVERQDLTRSSLRAPDLPEPLPTPTPVVTPDPLPEIDPFALDENGVDVADRAAGLLSAEVPPSASGTLAVVAGEVAAPHPERPVRTIRVEVEEGLAVDGELFAATVMEILNDPRGWGADGSVSFARTAGEADLRVVLASQGLTDELCAPLDTVGLYSCGTRGHAVLNHMRWVEATEEFDDRTTYRQYLVNHEVGHLLGHGHVTCPGEGEVAPIMQQQTVAVGGCVPNGWPFPDAG